MAEWEETVRKRRYFETYVIMALVGADIWMKGEVQKGNGDGEAFGFLHR